MLPHFLFCGSPPCPLPFLTPPSLPRWIEQTWTWTQTRPDDNPNTNTNTSTGTGTGTECYACTRDGVPVFHSNRCGPTHQPEWEASAGSSLFPTQSQSQSQFHLRKDLTRTPHPSGLFGPLLDPRSKRVLRWNRALLIARGISLAIDPFFFHFLSFSLGGGGVPCVYVNSVMAGMVTLLRTCVDAVHLFHLWLQFRLAYVSNESLVIGAGKLVWNARAIAFHYLRSLHGFWFDIFVILPIPQAVFWLVVPHLMTKERSDLPMTILLLTFLFQFIPKVYHSLCLTRKMRKVTGYIFGSIWWRLGLTIIAYLVASHITGGIWYILALQRVVKCLRQQCERSGHCNLPLSCAQNPFVGNSTIIKNACLDPDGPFSYGIYNEALPIISINSISTRVLYPIYWGLISMSTWGNVLVPTCNWLETLYSIFLVLTGLTLFTAAIANIQVFLSVILAKGKQVQLSRQSIEWWMKRRQLPSSLRRRVRHFECHTWTTFGGDIEIKWIEDLPEGLRRDIKRHVCLDLVKKVPLFHNLEDLILDNICDRVKPLIFSKDEKLLREGDPVKTMVFIMRGRVKRSQELSKGMVATSVLEPGGFLGDELLSWCLRRPFINRLPASSETFICMETVEAFGLDADKLKYITDHFRPNFSNQRLKRITRYHSSNWRSWAAMKIQLAWRRYRMRTRGPVMVNGGIEDRLRQYAVTFMSLRPHDHFE